MSNPRFVLTLRCPDRHGIIADVTTFLAGHCYNIEESSQFEDRLERRFFMRSEFSPVNVNATDIDTVRRQFGDLAQKDSMDWQICSLNERPRIVIAVSQWGHCLNALLHKWKQGTLPVEIAAVVSNHEQMRDLVDWYNLPYHYLPISKENKPQQEAQLYGIMQDSRADFLVLARYMQILSNDLCQKLQGRAINIHHSFLPGFKGARPYHQAYDRGVKLIGATAHFVTADLDEGPIIEQEVERVSHSDTPQELVEIGHDIESVVLCRAVRWHAEHRVLVNGHRTVVFRR